MWIQNTKEKDEMYKIHTDHGKPEETTANIPVENNS